MREVRKYSDRKRYLIQAVAKRRKKVRSMAIEHLGGKCAKCGYSKYPEVLEFHHKHPSEKDFSISKSGHCRSWQRVKTEIEKCNLLCANCHRELHAEQDKITALGRNAKLLTS